MMKFADEDTDQARTMMREPNATAGSGAPRRGTELLDLSAPVASPSAPRQPPLAGDALLPPGRAAPRPSLRARCTASRAAERPGRLAALVLGFLVGVLVIGIGLGVYLMLQR